MVAQRTGLVTGATGYVGRLVVEQLLRSGWRVKTLARSRGADCAWYLLHCMDDGAGFAQEETDMARQFDSFCRS